MTDKKIARVFPRKTAATPDDALAFFSDPPLFAMPEVDEIHVSVAFTYDTRRGEWLAEQWRAVGVPVHMGGPALGEQGGPFTPGQYLKTGYTITSRGCPNACWFCRVPAREGPLRELPIQGGWNVLDDNLLACSERHIRAVFTMLREQPQRPLFTGGLEAKRLRAWHVDMLRQSKARRIFFAYDEPADYEPLVEAGRLLRAGGISQASHRARCYVLIGYPSDTFDKAETRLYAAWTAGFLPFAMLFRDEQGEVDRAWASFQRKWVRPEILVSMLKKRNGGDVGDDSESGKTRVVL